MKISTWNVNGFRSVLKKGFHDKVRALTADVLCLQETKARLDQINEPEGDIPNYHRIWNAAERPGYSGVATYYHNSVKPTQVNLGIGLPEYDVEGRVIRIDLDQIVLFNIYFPNGQRGMDRVQYKLGFYSKLLEICQKLHQQGKQVIITGDFNTAHNEIDLANPRENSKTSGFLPEERAWIDIYLNNGFKDAYRVLYPDKVEYTWWTYRFNARARGIGWRLDYFLISDSLLHKVNDVVIHNEIDGSDHCPVSLMIDIS